jgi:hypothetical protein
MTRACRTLPSRIALRLALALPLFLAVPASAQTLSCAQPVELVALQIARVAPPEVRFTTHKGEQARQIVARFNAEPPASEIEADQVIIGTSPAIPRAVIIFSLRGCFVEASWIAESLARAMLGEDA